MQIMSLNLCQNNSYKRNNNKSFDYNISTPSFGMNNPHLALLRAQNLKAEYAKAGLNYLLPNQVWSTKKIMKTTNKAIEEYDKLLTKGEKITKESLNGIISKILPKELADKIVIKDLKKEFPKCLKESGYSESEIQQIIKTVSGCSAGNANESSIYINLDESKDILEKLDKEDTFAHEFKHALTKLTTNIQNHDKFNYPKEFCVYNKIFDRLEQTYVIDPYKKAENIEITDDNFIKNVINVNTNERFKNKNDFLENLLNELTESVSVFNKYLPKDCDMNSILKIMKHAAKDEKEAYCASSVFRKVVNDGSKSTGVELITKFYEILEKVLS